MAVDLEVVLDPDDGEGKELLVVDDEVEPGSQQCVAGAKLTVT